MEEDRVGVMTPPPPLAAALPLLLDEEDEAVELERERRAGGRGMDGGRP